MSSYTTVYTDDIIILFLLKDALPIPRRKSLHDLHLPWHQHLPCLLQALRCLRRLFRRWHVHHTKTLSQPPPFLPCHPRRLHLVPHVRHRLPPFLRHLAQTLRLPHHIPSHLTHNQIYLCHARTALQEPDLDDHLSRYVSLHVRTDGTRK
jgi:hypothetical protein